MPKYNMNITFLKNDLTAVNNSFTVKPLDYPTIYNDSLIVADVLNGSASMNLLNGNYDVQLNTKYSKNDFYIGVSGSSFTSISGSTFNSSSVLTFNLIDFVANPYSTHTITLTPLDNGKVYNDAFVIKDYIQWTTDNTGIASGTLIHGNYSVNIKGTKKDTIFNIYVSGSNVNAKECIVQSSMVSAVITPSNASNWSYTAQTSDARYILSSGSGSALTAVSSSYATTSVSASYSNTASYVPNLYPVNMDGYTTTASFNEYTSSVNNVINDILEATGSYITSSETGSMSVLSASYAITSSYFNGIVVSASYATTASYVRNAVSASYALTTSNGSPNFNVGNITSSGTILVSGSVGIGTTTPTSKLEVLGTKNAATLTVTSDLSSVNDYMDLQLSAGTGANNSNYLRLMAGAASARMMQIVAGGTTVASFNSSGDVGIGTTSPTANLSIAPSSGHATQAIVATGGNSSYLSLMAGSTGQEVRMNFNTPAAASNYKWWRFGSDANAFSIDRLNDTATGIVDSPLQIDSNGIILQRYGGNVGIGTTTPTSAKLVIAGNSSDTGLDLASTDQYAEMRVIRNSISNIDKDMYVQYQAGEGSKLKLFSNNTETMRLDSGRVGIGTQNPVNKLDVVGNISCSVITASLLNGTASYALTASNGSDVFTAKTINSSGSVNHSGSLNILNGPFLLKGGQSSIYADAPPGSYGLLQLSNTSLYTNQGIFGQGGAGLHLHAGDADTKITLYAMPSGVTTPSLTVAGNGDIGIGTTNPTAKLQVDTGGGSVYNNGLYIYNSSDVGYTNLKSVTNWSDGNGGTILDIANASGKALFIDNNRNVGIGTDNTSTAKLVIAGNSSDTGLDLASTDQYAEMRVIRNSISNIDKDMYVQYQAGEGSKLKLFSNNTETMRLDSGRVGIGTTSPAEKLSVSEGQFSQTDSSTYGGIKNFILQGNGNNGGVGFYGGIFGSNINLDGSVNKPMVKINNGPGITTAAAVSFSPDNAAASNAFGIWTGRGAANTLLTQRLAITHDGNVGIGTTTPSSNLTVSSSLSIGPSNSGRVFTTKIYPSSSMASSGWYRVASAGAYGCGKITIRSTAVNSTWNLTLDAEGIGYGQGQGHINILNQSSFQGILITDARVYNDGGGFTGLDIKISAAALTDFLLISEIDDLTLTGGQKFAWTLLDTPLFEPSTTRVDEVSVNVINSYQAITVANRGGNSFIAQSEQPARQSRPAYSFGNNISTGMYLADTGSIGFSSVGNNRMVINSSGVGIGTTSPATTLDVRGGEFRLQSNPGGDAFFTIGNNDGAGTYLSDNYNFIGFKVPTAYAAGNPTEAMRIVAGGNVGIGTTNPTAKLQVDTGGGGTNTNGIYLYNSPAVGYTNFKILNNWSDNNGGAMVDIGNASGKALFINNKRNIGIWNSNPTTAKLVIGGSPAQTGLDMATSDQYAEMRVIRNSLSGIDKDMYIQYQANANSKLRLYSNYDVETMTLTGSKVGIGTNSPNAKLHVVGDTTIIDVSKAVSGSINFNAADYVVTIPFPPTSNVYYGDEGTYDEVGYDLFIWSFVNVGGETIYSEEYNNIVTNNSEMYADTDVDWETVDGASGYLIYDSYTDTYTTTTVTYIQLDSSATPSSIGAGSGYPNVTKTSHAFSHPISMAGNVYVNGNISCSAITASNVLLSKYERHVQIPAFTSGNPSNQPSQADFFTVGGLQFGTTGTKYAYCQWEVPDDWAGDNIVFEVDWFPDSGPTTGTDTVKWNIEYRSIAEGELINQGTSVTTSSIDSGDYSQYQTKHARHTLVFNNANQPLTKQDHVFFKISRDTSVANDFGGSVTVPAFEIIYNSTGIPTSG